MLKFVFDILGHTVFPLVIQRPRKEMPTYSQELIKPSSVELRIVFVTLATLETETHTTTNKVRSKQTIWFELHSEICEI